MSPPDGQDSEGVGGLTKTTVSVSFPVRLRQ